jgi:outer membrane murein-binding lipoprotein Lpp
MNHLGDTNKMVRDTPRMDASAHDDGAIWQTGCEIERELNAASVEIERLTAKVAQLYEGAEEANQRIKRLEEAVDAYRTAYTPDGHVAPHDCFATGPMTGNPIQDLIACPGCWAERKAKEAKL